MHSALCTLANDTPLQPAGANLTFLYFYTHPQYLARVAAGLPVLVVALWVFYRPTVPTRDVLVVLTTVLLVSPILHPWYLLWIAPLLVLHPSRALILWTGLAPLSYLFALLDPEGLPPGGMLLYLEYVPVYFVLAWELLRRRGVRRASLQGTPPAGC